MKEILKHAGMNLYKWCDNHPDITVEKNHYPFLIEEYEDPRSE